MTKLPDTDCLACISERQNFDVANCPEHYDAAEDARRAAKADREPVSMTISIHDYENNRVIVAGVPEYLLAGHDGDPDGIAAAILTALGLSHSNTEYMIGETIALHLDIQTASDRKLVHGLADFVQDFKEDALAALADNDD